MRGFCIDVFTAALNLLPYAVPYTFIPFGDGHDNPNYSELVNLITSDVCTLSLSLSYLLSACQYFKMSTSNTNNHVVVQVTLVNNVVHRDYVICVTNNSMNVFFTGI